MTVSVKTGIQFRAATIRRDGIDEKARTVELSFSSGDTVERCGYDEILDHSPQSVRLGRLNSGANLILDHDPSQVVGVIEKAVIGADRKGRAVVRFGKSARAEEIFQDVKDGIRQNVSVGYLVYKFIDETPPGGDGPEKTYRATDWEPLEISLVAVPADISVGVGRGRSAASGGEYENHQPEIIHKEKIMAETQKEDKKEKRDFDGIDLDKVRIEIEERFNAEHNKRIAEMTAMGKKFNCERIALEFIANGKNAFELQTAILEDLRGNSTPAVLQNPANLDLTGKEVKRFSIFKCIRALAENKPHLAPFERECSDEIAKRTNRQPEGFLIPLDIQRGEIDLRQIQLHRDLNVGTATAGGNLVATNLLSASFIELLRNAMMVRQLGAMVLGGLVGNVAIPRQTGGATAYWVGESSNITAASQQAFDQVLMSPKIVGAYTDISRQLLLQSSLDVEGLVRFDLATVIALAIDYAALFGSGNNYQPKGIMNQTGVGSVAMGADGGVPDRNKIVEFETLVSTANAMLGDPAWLTNSKVRGKLKTTPKLGNTFPVFLLDDNNTMNGYPVAISNQVPSNLLKGNSGATLSALLYGVWGNLIIGEWGILDIKVDATTKGLEGGLRVIMLQDVDVAVRQPSAFAVSSDVVTA